MKILRNGVSSSFIIKRAPVYFEHRRSTFSYISLLLQKKKEKKRKRKKCIIISTPCCTLNHVFPCYAADHISATLRVSQGTRSHHLCAEKLVCEFSSHNKINITLMAELHFDGRVAGWFKWIFRMNGTKGKIFTLEIIQGHEYFVHRKHEIGAVEVEIEIESWSSENWLYTCSPILFS